MDKLSPRGVSVIIAVNEWRPYVIRALRSIRGQQYLLEAVIVDNAPKETSVSRYVKQKFSFAKVIKSDKSNVAYHARNIGIDAALGQYIAILDSDDEFLPNHLERSVTTLNTEMDLFMVCSSCRRVDMNGQKKIESFESNEFTLASYIVNLGIIHSTVVFRNNGLLRYPSFKHRHDYAAWLNILSRGYRVKLIKELGSVIHERRGSLSDLPKIYLVVKQLHICINYSDLPLIKTCGLFAMFILKQVKLHIKKRYETLLRK